MIKAKRWREGDKVAIVSLSRGILGEEFVSHNLEIGCARLRAMGLEPVFMANTLKGIDYLREHPEKRAQDLIDAFSDASIKGIICAIGGDDTYKTLPYLLDKPDFKELVRKNPKIFTGFSDTTTNHLMLYKLGLVSYYGMAFITDLGEISESMLPYTEEYFNYYLDNAYDFQKIKASPVWYEERTDFSKAACGQERICHEDSKGFELLQGRPIFEGKLLGGCLDSLYDMLVPYSHPNQPQVIKKYEIFPSLKDWQDKILFLETSEVKEKPAMIKKMLLKLKEQGIFEVLEGIIFGKPQDEAYYDEYKEVIKEVIANPDLPVLYNVNFGHATPRTIIPLGIKARVDFPRQEIVFLEEVFEK
ncbi:LD-carboxypeptidase [Streptococcaceae bacterium ESL0729]|nr:LD-carboxypeptidase [Streptococcaceae bacterium ESL0729]